MISVVVPVRNEGGNIRHLVLEIMNSVSLGAPVTEIVYVDDGSTDETSTELKSLQNEIPILSIIHHSKSCGQSLATWTGVMAAKNNLIVTLDGDGQNNPADIPVVYNAYSKAVLLAPQNRFMVAGQRVGRQDTWIRKISSRIANTIRSQILKDNTRDTGCSLKLFTKQDFLFLPYFDHMHRFIPALMGREGVVILHVDVSHRPRTKGVSKYGTIDRLLAGILDLFGVWWLLKRKRVDVKITKEQ